MFTFRLLKGFVVLAWILAASTALGQTQTGSIEGRVNDKTGAVLPGVSVTLASPVLLTAQVRATDQSGRYVFVNLVPGTYTLTFELSGFQKLVREGLIVSVAKTITIDVTLEVAGVQEAVTVTGATPEVDLTSTNVATNLDQGLLQEVPTSRDVWSILQTQAPAVVLDREDVGGSEGGLQAVFSVRGTTWHQNTYSMNGVNVTDPAATGATDFYFDYDSFEEINISTGSHSAEVATPGVYLNLVAKTGTDNFRGGAAYYYENSSLVSDNIDQELRDAGVSRGSSINLFSDFTAQFGGPIAKDKLRFYTNWRDWRIHRNVVNVTISENTDLFSGLGNVTWQLNPKNQITALYTVQTYLKPHRNISATVQPEASWIEDDVFTIAQGTWTSTVNDKNLLNARVSYARISFPLSPQPEATEAANIDLGTGVWSRAAPLYYDPAQIRDRLSINGAWTRFVSGWGGNHDFKLGAEYQTAGDENVFSLIRDVVTYTVNGVPASVELYNTPVENNKQHFYEVNFFAQDSWKPNDQTTVNLGLRFSATRGYLPEQGSPAGAFFPARDFPRQDILSWNTFAPRLGVIYDLKGNGNHAAKVSYGRYYHAVSTGFIGSPNNNGLGARGHVWNDNGDRIFQVGEQGALLYQFGGSTNTVDPDLKQPYTDEFIVGMDNELPFHNIRLSVNFTYRRKTDLIGFVNAGVPDSGYFPVTAIDPGRDGVTGTTDDRPIQVFNLRPEFAGRDRLVETNPEGFDGDYKGVEIVAQKRFARGWQFLASYAVGKSTLERTSITNSQFGGEEEGAGGVGFGFGTSAYTTPNSGINNSGESDFYDRTHIVKLVASYQIPKIDVNLAGVFKSQTGTPYARILTLTQDANGNPFNQGTISIFAEPRGTFRFPTIRAFDLRLSKFFDVRKHRFEFIVDFFNLTNANVVTDLNVNSGAVFQDPTNVYGPRVVRFGGRWLF
jgi:hypothetical protein